MIVCPESWRQWRAGDVIMYAPREGHLRAVMTYEERSTPLRSFATLLHEILTDDVEFELAEKSRITRFLTDEGEYGARIVARGTFRGRPIAHVVAAIFSEDFCNVIDARVEADVLDAHVAMVAGLAKQARLGLGVRRRRVAFTPPAGWHPIPGLDLEIALLPPDYPRRHASIVMFAADPFNPDVRATQTHLDRENGLTLVEETSSAARTTARKAGYALLGTEWRQVLTFPDDQGKLVRHLVVMRDDRFVYATKLEMLEGASSEGMHEVFVQAVGSIEPIPQPIGARGVDAGSRFEIFEIWND